MSPWLRSSSGAEAVETEVFPGDLHGVEVAQGQDTELQICDGIIRNVSFAMRVR